ncbi:hypothetical protein BH09VER1_BH09VER1_36270 [soil metagenome]
MNASLPASAEPKIYRCGTLSYTGRGLIVLFAWMLWGDFCFTLMEAVVPSILPLKLRSLDSPNILIGLIMTTLPGIFNVTVTPWLSFKSDRYRSRWGRRLPFIISTVPFISLALIAIGFSGDLGAWVHGRFFGAGTFSQAQVTIVLLAVFAAAFDLFNMFVNTVYWYLFNDVVPKEWLGRFMGWFRLVGISSASCYNIFVFQYAESHMREIFLGAALLYFVGFGVMCLRIKEGQYPDPVDDGNRVGPIEKIKIFARECFTIRYYWDIFLTYTFAALATCIYVFQVFMLKSLGLTLGDIGKLAGFSTITVPLFFLFSGWLVDRWHPVRVFSYLAAFELCVIFANWMWLFIPLPPAFLFVSLAALNGAFFGALFRAVYDTAGMVRLMVLFPKEQFGQFSGAMALVRAVAIILGGVLAGAYVDLWKHFFPKENFAYRFNFLWLGVLMGVSFYFQYRTYRAWKRLGGVEAYQAPTTNFRLKDLLPHPGDDGKIVWGLVGVTAVAMLGNLISSLVWLGYYIWKEPNQSYAFVSGMAVMFTVISYAIYLWFIKFMERP